MNTDRNLIVDRLSDAGRATYQRLSALTDAELAAKLNTAGSTAIAAVCVDLLARLEGYKSALATVTATTSAARAADPETSSAAAEKAQQREGSLARFKRGTHRHRLLSAYAEAGRPLHDHAAAVLAGLDEPNARKSGGRRQSELRKVGYITATGETAVDPFTGVSGRLCEITANGMAYLRELARDTEPLESPPSTRTGTTHGSS